MIPAPFFVKIRCQRVEFGIPTYFMSDYDILIVTEKRMGINENNLYSKISRLFFRNKEWRFHTHPQFINISISELNNQIDQGGISIPI